MQNGKNARRPANQIGACSKALAVLSSDEARNFTKTFNPALVNAECQQMIVNDEIVGFGCMPVT